MNVVFILLLLILETKLGLKLGSRLVCTYMHLRTSIQATYMLHSPFTCFPYKLQFA